MIESQIHRMAVTEQATNPLSEFLYALKAPETRRQWPNRLKVVFHLLGLTGDLDHQARQFVTLYREAGMAVVHGKLTSFISYQIQRAQKKEISLTTIPNYQTSPAVVGGVHNPTYER